MKKGWQLLRLEVVCKEITDGSHFSPKTTISGYPYVTVRDIDNDQIDFTSCKFICDDDYKQLLKSGCKPNKGDVLFSKDGTVGKVALINYDKDFVVLSSLAIVRPDTRQIRSDFLKWIMKSPEFLGEAVGMKTGVAIRRIILRNLKSILIPVPPLPEQHRIVAILDEAFENIAAAKANAEQNLKNARELFESHLQAVFTQRGEGWVEKTLGDACNFIGGSQPPKSVFTHKPKSDHVRLIQIRDYKSDKHLVYIPRSLARRFCKADDVMIGRYGPPLFQILRGLEGAYNVALMKAEPDESKITRDFLFFFLKHPAMLQHVIYHSSRAAGQIGLTKETLEPYPIYLPSLAGQKKVVDKILQLESDTQRLESIYKQKIAALDELKKALLHKAFAGEL